MARTRINLDFLPGLALVLLIVGFLVFGNRLSVFTTNTQNVFKALFATGWATGMPLRQRLTAAWGYFTDGIDFLVHGKFSPAPGSFGGGVTGVPGSGNSPDPADNGLPIDGWDGFSL